MVDTHPFSFELLQWGSTVDRPMPWRGIRDPYKIWLSEVILQQTRVEQGMGYYHRFLTAFPSVEDLAAAEEQQVLALWQGLGYYSRARNLLKATKQVAESGGVFPTSFKDLLELPGVGPYSAAAIASFAYNEPVAVLDGNVYRVLSRHFNVDLPINKPQGHRHFRALANHLLPKERPAAYNQAIMDFGALVCKPKQPLCLDCPLQSSCLAYEKGLVNKLPLKQGKPKRRSRYFNYLFLTNKAGQFLIKQRGSGDIWQGLFDFPLYETKEFEIESAVLSQQWHWLQLSDQKFASRSTVFKHLLSHQDIHAVFWHYECQTKVVVPKGYIWVSRSDLKAYGLPRLIEKYLGSAALELGL